jgi:hypothetical protein
MYSKHYKVEGFALSSKSNKERRKTMRKTIIAALFVLVSISAVYASDRDMDMYAKINAMFTSNIASVARYCDLHYKKIVNTSAPALPESYVTTRRARVYTHAEYAKAQAEFRAQRQAGTALYAVCPLKDEFVRITGGMLKMETFIGFQKTTNQGGEGR